MFHSLILSFLLLSSQPTAEYSCVDDYEKHPVRNEFMLQIVLKSYNYYTGKIDGEIGTLSINALKDFQRNNNAAVDGILGPETCFKLLNKSTLLKKAKNKSELKNTENANAFSQEINDAQIILKKLDLYTGSIDGINGPGTKRAVREFQSKAGLSPDGVIGPQTLAALSKGENAYTTENIDADSKAAPIEVSTPNSSSSAIDLRNYNPNAKCADGYVNSSDVCVPDPCFYPVFVYLFGNIAQVNSQNELDSYLDARWSLTKEKTY